MAQHDQEIIQPIDVGLSGDVDVTIMNFEESKYCKFDNVKIVYDYTVNKYFKNSLYYNDQDIVYVHNEMVVIVSLNAKRSKKYNISSLVVSKDNIIMTIVDKNDKTKNISYSLLNIFDIIPVDENSLKVLYKDNL